MLKKYITTTNNKVIDYIVSKIRKVSIFYRLVITFFLIIFIPNITISYLGLVKTSNQMKENAVSYTDQYISNVNDILRERLSKYDDLTFKIYMNEEINNLLARLWNLEHIKTQRPEAAEEYDKLKHKLKEILFDYKSMNKNIVSIEIVTQFDEFTMEKEGTKAGGKLRNPLEFRKSQLYRDALQGNLDSTWYAPSEDEEFFIYQSNPYVMGNYVMNIRSIKDWNSQKKMGVVIVNFSRDIFSGVIYEKQSRQQGNIILLNNAHKPLLSLNENISVPSINEKILMEIAINSKGSLISKLEGKECIIVYETSSYMGWKLVNIIEVEKLLESIYRLKGTIIKTTVICMLLAVIISYLVTLSIYIPMKSLRYKIDNIKEKGKVIEYEDLTKDEMGSLDRSFNHMINEINILLTQIIEVELEKKQKEINLTKEGARRKEAELNALQMQVNPHFLYNTLDIIRWNAMFEHGGESKVSNMISDFSKLLKLGINRNVNVVDISEEIEHVKAYLKVISFNEKNEVDMDIDIDEQCIACKIPKLTLQPIVENAIRHGFEHKEPSKKMCIRVTKQEDKIVIQVTDSGKGIDKSELEELIRKMDNNEEKNNSIGLKNVNERIKLYFGTDYGVKVKSEIGAGTTVEILLPSE
jgi:two-component system, sensor histidine kinase YesM